MMLTSASRRIEYRHNSTSLTERSRSSGAQLLHPSDIVDGRIKEFANGMDGIPPTLTVDPASVKFDEKQISFP
jgi:hypothetical protein